MIKITRWEAAKIYHFELGVSCFIIQHHL